MRKRIEITPALFPGNHITIPPLVITDWVNNEAKCTSLVSVANHSGNSSCRIDIRKDYDSSIHPQNRISILLENTNVSRIIPLYFISTQECLAPSIEVAVKLQCDNASEILHFIIRECPLGYTFKTIINTMGRCYPVSKGLVYDSVTGVVCVTNNKWYGPMSVSKTHNIILY